jgi:hypothetical protein
MADENKVNHKEIRSSDPEVIKFVEFLGINPNGLTKVVIIIEAQKPVSVEVFHDRVFRKVE